MGSVPSKERLQPSLLDRLTDEQPSSRGPRPIPAWSSRRLRDSVLRDLEFLLNTTRSPVLDDVAGDEVLERSTLNYGIPDLIGKTQIDAKELEVLLRRAITDFEPRLSRSTLRVRHLENPMVPGKGPARPNVLSFHIEAELWAHPLPERLVLRTDVDVELGQVKITPTAGG